MPDQSTDARPFLPLSPGPRNKLRQRVMGGGPKPRENVAAHGQDILRQVEDFQRIIDAQAAKRAPDLPPLPDDTQLIIEAKRLGPERMGALGLSPIEERDDGLVVTVTPDVTLPTLVTKAQGYISQRTDSGNPKFNGVISPIEQIRPAERADKVGDTLAAYIEADRLEPSQPVWVDIELAGGQTDAGARNRQQFYDYLRSFSTELPPYAEDVVTATGHFMIEPDYSLHRVLLPGRAVLDLLDDSRANWILSLDLVPEIEDRTVPLAAAAGADLPSLPTLPDDAPRVVIIDSGIAANHPLFRDAAGRTIIGRQLNFLPESVEPADLTTDEIDQGHGTAVASIAAYGSLMDVAAAPEKAAAPVFWIENAKVMTLAAKITGESSNGAPQFHPLQFPKALMRDVVAAFHRPLPQQCKIFTLSTGAALHPRHTISNWAEELDNLSAQNDILFVAPTGNLQREELTRLLETGVLYPACLLDPQARLRNPGQAYSALIVGALTPVPPTAVWQRDRSMAPAEHPAPFSRSGSLSLGPVKPDVVEVGGNIDQANLSASPETAILVANRNFASGEAEQPLGFHYGAGLAAAKVTNLAGRVQAQYPQAGSNLIRALIVNSAEWPKPFVDTCAGSSDHPLSKEARQMLLRLCGYGVPQPEKALSANAHCMVFVAEDLFDWTKDDKNSSGRYPAKVSFFSIHLEPDDLFGLPPATRLRVSVTLAYNPPVRKTQRRRYQAVDIRWELKRRDETGEDFQARWMAGADTTDEEGEGGDEVDLPRPRPWPWELKPALNPGGRVRRGSLIRDWFDVYAHELPHRLELVTLATVAPWRKPPEPLTQRYAVVVSIETLDETIPLYDSVRVQEINEQ